MNRKQKLLFLIAAAWLWTACGEITNQDLVFLAAIPRADELELIVDDEPQVSMSQTLRMAQVGMASSTYLSLNGVAEEINVQVAAVLEVVDDLGRGASPTRRDDDRRVWQGTTGSVLFRLEIQRVQQDDSGRPTYTFCFHGAELGATSGDPECSALRSITDGSNGWRAVLYGEYSPENAAEGARTGAGTITLDFEAARAAGFEEDGDAEGRLSFNYDIDAGGESKSLELFLTPRVVQIPGRETFAWAYALSPDGEVSLAVEFAENAEDTDPNTQELLQIDSCWTLNGAGVATFTQSEGDIAPTALIQGTECWDAEQILTYLRYEVDDTVVEVGDASSCRDPCP